MMPAEQPPGGSCVALWELHVWCPLSVLAVLDFVNRRHLPGSVFAEVTSVPESGHRQSRARTGHGPRSDALVLHGPVMTVI